MTYDQLRLHLKDFVEGNRFLRFLSKIAPVLVLLRPLHLLFSRLLSLIPSDSLQSFVFWFDNNLGTFFLIVFVVGVILSFAYEKTIFLILGLTLSCLHYILAYFTSPPMLNILVALSLNIACLVYAIQIASRIGDLKKAKASLQETFSFKDNRIDIACPTCGHPSQLGVPFCSHCGAALPQPVAKKAPSTPVVVPIETSSAVTEPETVPVSSSVPSKEEELSSTVEPSTDSSDTAESSPAPKKGAKK